MEHAVVLRLARALSALPAAPCLYCPVGAPLRRVIPLALAAAAPSSLPLPPALLLLAVFVDPAAAADGEGEPGAEPGEEMRLAAAARVPEAWRWLGPRAGLERLSQPARGLYRRRTLLWPGDEVELAALPGRRIVIP